MKFVCSLILVDNIQRSREFYEKTLKQKVKYNFGVNVTFEGDFAIHWKEHFEEIAKLKDSRSVLSRTHNFELYFETENIDEIAQELKNGNIQFLHGIEEQPWGQRVSRFYDPDGHIVEIGETMEAVVLRLYRLGNPPEEIGKRTGMPMEFIEGTLKNNP